MKGIENIDTKNVEYMQSMFYKCESLEYLDLSSFDTEKVGTNSAGTFGSTYKQLPAETKTLVPIVSYLADVSDTTLCFRKLVNELANNIGIFEFGVYKEDGTKIKTVENNNMGEIFVETKDLTLGKYYVQETTPSTEFMFCDTSRQYFTIEEPPKKPNPDTPPQDDKPKYHEGNTPNPNRPDSPDEFTLIGDDGTPLATYKKVLRPDGSFIYISDEGVPLGEVPKTQDIHNITMWYMIMLISGLAAVWQALRKDTN